MRIAVSHRRISRARGLRLLRHRLPRSPGPAPHPDAGGIRRLAAAPGLPDGRGTGDLHTQRARDAEVVRVSVHRSTPAHGGDILGETGEEVIGTAAVERTAAGEALAPEEELLTINFGPHHP